MLETTDLAAAMAVLIAKRGEIVLPAADIERAREGLITGRLTFRYANLGDGTTSFWTEEAL